LLADFYTTGYDYTVSTFYYWTGERLYYTGDLLSWTGDFRYLTGDFNALYVLKLFTIFYKANLDFFTGFVSLPIRP